MTRNSRRPSFLPVILATSLVLGLAVSVLIDHGASAAAPQLKVYFAADFKDPLRERERLRRADDAPFAKHGPARRPLEERVSGPVEAGVDPQAQGVRRRLRRIDTQSHGRLPSVRHDSPSRESHHRSHKQPCL